MDSDPVVLAAVAAWCFTVALAGGVVGLVLGNLRLPAILLVASSPAAGAGANLGISGIAALTAAGTHARRGRVNWRLFAWMAPPSIIGAVAGSLAGGALPSTALLAVIGSALVWFGIDLLRPRKRPLPVPDGSDLDLRAAVVSGGLVGLLGGLVGLILGALRMPALLRHVREAPARAVGTNLAVGVCVGAAGVAGHAPSGIDWGVLAVGGAASIPGALLGARLTGRLSAQALMKAIGGVLIIAGMATLATAFLR